MTKTFLKHHPCRVFSVSYEQPRRCHGDLCSFFREGSSPQGRDCPSRRSLWRTGHAPRNSSLAEKVSPGSAGRQSLIRRRPHEVAPATCRDSRQRVAPGWLWSRFPKIQLESVIVWVVKQKFPLLAQAGRN
jgi:hypothetical protein